MSVSGFADAIQGPWLMEQMGKAAHVGTEIISGIITKAVEHPSVHHDRRWQADLHRAVIIATGAQAKWLGLESEQKFQGFGVSACATCEVFIITRKCWWSVKAAQPLKGIFLTILPR